MLKFQTEVDEATGIKVLTCFLLPQQAYQLDYVGSYDSSLSSSASSSSYTFIIKIIIINV